MGKYIGTVEDLNLLGRLQDIKYHSKYNDIIKKELSRLKSVIQLIKDAMGSDPECKEANVFIKAIYRDNFLDWEGEDNWFCYHLGNKLNKEAGLEPLHNLDPIKEEYKIEKIDEEEDTTTDKRKIEIPRGNYEEDFKTAVRMYNEDNPWYERFLNDATRKLRIDFMEFKKSVEQVKEDKTV